MSEGIRVAAVEDIEDGEAVTVDAETAGTDDDISVFHSEGRFYALNDTCTHEEASLAEGWIEDGEVECPVHSARFCLATGKALCLPATVNARAHRVQVVGDDVILYPNVPPEAGAE